MSTALQKQLASYATAQRYTVVVIRQGRISRVLGRGYLLEPALALARRPFDGVPAIVLEACEPQKENGDAV